ncbi:glycosyltransferase [Pontimonas sp.]|nr:glycosyltransferase [Pontimonas sp.]
MRFGPLIRTHVLRRIREYENRSYKIRGLGYEATVLRFLEETAASNFEAFTVMVGRYPSALELEVFQLAKQTGELSSRTGLIFSALGRFRYRNSVQRVDRALGDFTNFFVSRTDSGIPNLSTALLEQSQSVDLIPVQWCPDGLTELPVGRAPVETAWLGTLKTSLAKRKSPMWLRIAGRLWSMRPGLRRPKRLILLPSARSVFVEPEIPSPENSSMLVDLVANQRLILTVVVHDLLPLTNPRWFRKDQVASHVILISLLEICRRAIVSTRYVERELRQLLRSLNEQDCEIVRISWPFISVEQAGHGEAEGIERNQVLFIGGFESRKNLVSVLAAFDYLPLRERGSLAVTGVPSSSPGETAVWSLAQSIPGVKLLEAPSRQRLFELVRESKAVLYPTLGEGFGLPIIEAFMLETTCVVSDLAVFRELAEDFPHIRFGWGQSVEANATILRELFLRPKQAWHFPSKTPSSGQDWARTVLLLANDRADADSQH